MKKRESYKKHLNRGVMAVSFAVIFIVFSIMGAEYRHLRMMQLQPRQMRQRAIQVDLSQQGLP